MAYVLVVIIEYLLCAQFMFLGPRSTDPVCAWDMAVHPGCLGSVLAPLGASGHDGSKDCDCSG